MVELLRTNNVNFNFSICDDSGNFFYKDSLESFFENLDVELKYFGWKENSGAAASIYKAGYNATGDILIFTDADGQFTPNDILRGIELYNNTSGIRSIIFNRVKKNDEFIKVIGSKLSSIICNYLLKTRVSFTDLNCCLKIIPKSVFDKLPLMARHLNYSFEMLFYLSRFDIKLFFLECASLDRKDGLSSLKVIRDGFSRLLFLLFLSIIVLLLKLRVLDFKRMEGM